MQYANLFKDLSYQVPRAKNYLPVLDPVIDFLYIYIKQTLLKFNMKVHYRLYYSILIPLVSLVFLEIYLNRGRYHGPINVYLCQILEFILLSVSIK